MDQTSIQIRQIDQKIARLQLQRKYLVEIQDLKNKQEKENHSGKSGEI